MSSINEKDANGWKIKPNVLNEGSTEHDEINSETQEESKFYEINGQSWWIPLNHQLALAVEIDSQEDYREAVKDKLMSLIEQATVAERKQALAPLGAFAKMIDVNNPWTMMNDLMDNGMLAEMIMEGDPETAQAETDEDQIQAIIDEQENLNLGNFLAD